MPSISSGPVHFTKTSVPLLSKSMFSMMTQLIVKLELMNSVVFGNWLTITVGEGTGAWICTMMFLLLQYEN